MKAKLCDDAFVLNCSPNEDNYRARMIPTLFKSVQALFFIQKPFDNVNYHAGRFMGGNLEIMLKMYSKKSICISNFSRDGCMFDGCIVKMSGLVRECQGLAEVKGLWTGLT